MKYLVLTIIFLSGCQTINPAPIMPGELQALKLMQCNSLNLDYQVEYNQRHQVVGITCTPRFGYIYRAPSVHIEDLMKGESIAGEGADLNTLNEGQKK